MGFDFRGCGVLIGSIFRGIRDFENLYSVFCILLRGLTFPRLQGLVDLCYVPY